MSQFYDQASLVMIPSGYKTGKVYSQKPLSADGELTFTRASNATRVNADGLIEKVRTNIILQSNQFDTTWARTGTNVPTSNAIANPLSGAVDAFKLVESAVTSFHFIVQYPVFSTGEVSFSFYAKAAERTTCSILLTQSGSNGGFFDLSTGVATASGAGNTASMVALSNGWYRCNVTNNGSATVVNQVRIGIADGALGSYAGDGTSGIYIYAAQAEQGVPTDYIPTTTAAVSVGPVSGLPRLDYSDGCPALKLEPQRSNLVTFSESFDDSSWYKVNSNVTANYITSPDGYQNADKFAFNVSGDSSCYKPVSGASNIYTQSIFAKHESGAKYLYFFSHSNSGGAVIWFDLEAGSVSRATSGYSGSVQSFDNGWFRFSMTNSTNENLTYMQFGVSSNDTDRNCNQASVSHFYGAQIEQGAYATSYIPTLSTSVTRLADIASKTGVSSLIGQTEGTIFFEVNDFSYNPQAVLFKITGLISSQTRTTNQIRFEGTGYDYFYTPTQKHLKIAAAYTASTIVIYVNGVQVHEDTSVTISGGSNLIFNETGNGTEILNQALLFKTRLTNAQLAELTAL